MKCKNCKKEFSDKQYGLRDFHSPECRDEYRRVSQAKAKQKSRKTENTMSISSPLDVNKSKHTESTICDIQNDESETLYTDFGGKAWYSLAKKYCSNFEVKLREKYCTTFAETYFRFTWKCSDCPVVGKDLMKRVKGTWKKAA